MWERGGRCAAPNVERLRFGWSARILDFLPILAKNASMGIDGSAAATGAWPVATYKYKAAGRINTPTSTPSKNLSIGLKVSYLRNFLPATRINRLVGTKRFAEPIQAAIQ